MWPRVALMGYGCTMPAVCPSCLAEAHEPVRCFHKDLFSCFYYPFGPAADTFFYCEACAEAARAGVRCDRLRRYLTYLFPLLVLAFVVAGVMGLIVRLSGPLNAHWKSLPESVKLVVWFLGTALLWRLVVGGYRRIQRKRYPKTDAQVVWGVAAYYTCWDNYKAARPEWIEALVRCNPERVKDKVYRRITGEDPPS